MPVTLDPPAVECSVDQQPLTDLVKKQLELEIPVVGYGQTLANPLASVTKPRDVADEPYLVMVDCPGRAGVSPTPHQESVEGRYSRDSEMPARARAKVWFDAAVELSPAKSLARITDDAKFLAGTVSLVGSAFTAAGLVAFDRLRLEGLPFVLAALAAGGTVVAVLIATSQMILRTGLVDVGNLLRVKRWYDGQWRRAKLLSAAGWLLVASIGLAAADGAYLAIFAEPPPPALSLSLVGTGAKELLSGSAVIVGLTPGTPVDVTITGGSGTQPPTLLARSRSLSDATGKVEFSAAVADITTYGLFRLEVVGPRGRFFLELSR